MSKKTRLLESNYFSTHGGGAAIEMVEIHTPSHDKDDPGYNRYELELRIASQGHSSSFRTPIISPSHAIQFAKMLTRVAEQMKMAAQNGLIQSYYMEKWYPLEDTEGNVQNGIRLEKTYGEFAIDSHDTASFQLGERWIETGTNKIIRTEIYEIPKALNGGACGSTGDRGPARFKPEDIGRQIFYDRDTRRSYFHPTSRIDLTKIAPLEDHHETTLEQGEQAEIIPVDDFFIPKTPEPVQSISEILRIREPTSEVLKRFEQNESRWS